MSQPDPETVAPLSPSQARLWFLQRLDPSSATYNESGVWHFDVELDPAALQAALVNVAQRQTMLRTRFRVVDGLVVQHVDAHADLEFECIDLGSDVDDTALEAIVRDRARRPFDLVERPAVRTILYRRSPGRCVFQRVWHHIMCDGLSAGVLNREFSQAYAAALRGDHVDFPPLAVDYAQFTRRRLDEIASPAGAADLAYWKQRLAHAPTLSLPIDFERPATQSHRGGVVHDRLDAATVAAVRALARRADASTLLTLFTAYAALLVRLSGDDDLLIGFPVSGRTPDVEDVIGFFATTLVHRADFSGHPSVLDAIARTRDSVREALAHQAAPFEALVGALPPSRDRSRNPLFQVAFSMRRGELSELTLEGTHAHRVATELGESRFDLTLMLVERADGCIVRWEYATDLFDASTIERMARLFRTLLDAMVRTPEAPIAACSLDATSRDAGVRMGLGERRPYPQDDTVHGRFAAQAAATPNATAIGTLGYAELDAASNRLCALLRAEAVEPQARVAVASAASERLAVAWLAILKAGAVYVPMTADVPLERIETMLADASVTHVVADEALASRFANARRTVVCPDRDAARIALQSVGAPPPSLAGADSPAYVMFTSGSTGRPKGVVIPHRAILRLVCNTDYVQLGPSDVVAQLASPAFDASTFEFWGALLNGARIAPIDKTVAIAPRAFAAALASEGVTVIFLTTALFNLVAREVPEAFRSCRTVLFGGEAVEPRYVRKVLDAGGPQRLLHVYGPTETTTFATWHPVRDVLPRATTIPIGRPVANAEVFVLRPDGAPVAPGEVGSIHIGGPGLAIGYLDRADDDVAFVVAPVGALPPRRLYRTGDRARLGNDGAIEFLGRVDEQVKLRGHRIELGEIRAAMLRAQGMQDAVVVVRGETSDTREIVAYAVAADDGRRPAEELWRELRRALPAYALPAAIVWLRALPLNANGKVDKRRLPAATADDARPEQPREAYVGMLEVQVTRIVENLLRRKGVRLHDRFFDLGGHSLLAARLVDVIEAATGVAIPLTSLFADDSIAGIVRSVRDAATAPTTPLFMMNERGTRPPFVFLHGDFTGGGFYSRTLARALGDDQPVVIVHPHGLSETRIPATIEAMAADRLAALRRERPCGPYIVGGHCNGAFVALEMARMLRAQGESVPAVVIVDAPSPRLPDEPLVSEDATVMMRDRDGSIRALDPNDRIAAAQITYMRAMNRYTGGPCDAHLVIVSSRHQHSGQHDVRWSRLARTSERFVLPGTHVTLVTLHVRLLARVVGDAIGRKLAELTPAPSAAAPRAIEAD